MDKEFLTSLDFSGFRNMKDKEGVEFGYIEHEIRDKDKKVGMLKSSKIINSCGISLNHWKFDYKYYTQWIIHERGKITELDPHISNLPIYENDNNRDKHLKKMITWYCKHIEIGKIDTFLSEIFHLFENVEHDLAHKRIYRKLKLKTNSNIKKVDSNVTKDQLDDTHKLQLLYPTSHLKCFDELVSVTRLIGDEYKPILKTVWYGLLSTVIATNELVLGIIATDGRIHILIFLKSGSGKSEIKRTIKKVLDGIDKSYIEPTSFHPEQFVGKIRIEKDKEGNKTYHEIRGHLSLDYILIDEAKNLLTSNEALYTESRRYLRSALDPYPNNEVTKKSVDIEHEHALKYKPHCCVSIFLQPYSLSQEIVLDGDFRRFVVPYVQVGGINKEEIYRNRIREKQDYKQSLKVFTDFINSLNKVENFTLQNKSIDLFEELSVLLINKGKSRSYKVRNYMDITDLTIQNILLKFAAVQALQENKSIIEPKHVELAFLDYGEILEHTYDFVENKILGKMDYGDNWNGAIQKDQEMLKWLYNKGATTVEDSNVSIKEYKDKIKQVYNVADRQARRYKEEHEKNGWIESKKGQHDSKVWLTFKPETESSLGLNKVRVDKDFRDKYTEIINKYDSVIEK